MHIYNKYGTNIKYNNRLRLSKDFHAAVGDTLGKNEISLLARETICQKLLYQRIVLYY